MTGMHSPPAPEETIGIPDQAGVAFDAKAAPGALRVVLAEIA